MGEIESHILPSFCGVGVTDSIELELDLIIGVSKDFIGNFY